MAALHHFSYFRFIILSEVGGGGEEKAMDGLKSTRRRLAEAKVLITLATYMVKLEAGR
ncbi:hypothetical protein P792_00025 [Asaia sp. SF2.1]|nr:hypothetical protein P792_00025 [Asaia sp. SF2.1]